MPDLGHDAHICASTNHSRSQILCELGNGLDGLLSHSGIFFVDLTADQYDHRILILQMQC
jgi:hypothetical protein